MVQYSGLSLKVSPLCPVAPPPPPPSSPHFTFLYKAHFQLSILSRSVVDPEPRSGIRCFFDPWIWDPGSGMVFFRIPDRIPNPHLWEFSYNFLDKKFYSSSKIGPNIFLQHFKNKIINNFVKFVATKKGLTKKCVFTPLFSYCFWIRDPESEICDPGSGMGKNQDPGSGIHYKHPGSATLLPRNWNLLLCAFCSRAVQLQRNTVLSLLCSCPKLPYCSNQIGIDRPWKLWSGCGNVSCSCFLYRYLLTWKIRLTSLIWSVPQRPPSRNLQIWWKLAESPCLSEKITLS